MLYCFRIKGASPTGNLEVRNQAPYVDGYGEVELTNSAQRRTITQVRDTDGNDGDLLTDGSDVLTLEYEGTTTTSKSTSNTITDPSNFPVSVSDTIPSDGQGVALEAVLRLNGGDAEAQAVFDTDGDAIGEQTTTLSVSGAASNFESVRTDTGEKSVQMQNYSDADADAVFSEVEVVISWNDPQTTTLTRSVTLF